MFKLFDTDNSLTLDEFELVQILESQFIVPLLHKWTRTH
jgi:Ca2+-binding EF-hand superfamily protein